MTDNPSPFHQALAEIGELHDRKQADYGTDADPFANVRASEQFGIPAWLGAVIRLNDKVSRLKTFAVKGNLKNESVEDSLLDAAVYSLIALVLYREGKEINSADVMAEVIGRIAAAKDLVDVDIIDCDIQFRVRNRILTKSESSFLYRELDSARKQIKFASAID